MPTTTVCIDANIVVRLVTDPDDRAIAALWRRWDREGIAPAAPSLILYEVTNALYRYQRTGRLSSQAVDEALTAALALPMEICDAGHLCLGAMRIARRLGLSAAYDGHYLALAQSLDAELWTTDRRLFNSVQTEYPKIHLAERIRG